MTQALRTRVARRGARRVLAGAVAVASLAVAGCGSTVEQAGGRPVSEFSPQESQSVEGEVRNGPGLGNGSLGGDGPATAVGGRTTTSAAPGAGAQDLSGSTRTVDTDQPIKIGLMYSTDTNTVLAAMGANTRTGDARQMQDAVIAHINESGGVAGHPIEPAYHNVSATDSPSDISQRACTQWTQDDKVFAAMPMASVQDNALMRTCLGNAGVPAVYPNFYNETLDREFNETPLWFEIESLSLDAWARAYAAGLAQQGFFKDARIGLVHDDGPAFTTAVEQVLLPALRDAGANVVATAAERIHGANDLASGSSQMSSAVLKFQTERVSHVIFFEVWQGWFLFLRHAESQGWRPTYGLSTQNAPQIMIESGLVPMEQLPGARLVGWNPGVDVPVTAMGEWPRLKLCKQIYADAGIEVDTTNTQAHHGALSVCEGLLAFQDAGRGATPPLTPQSLARGLEGLGDGLEVANVPTARFGPGRHFAVDAWRVGSYVDGCTCFEYTGSWVGI